jgi:hypothetical protein
MPASSSASQPEMDESLLLEGIDDIIKENGHDPLYPPPYYPDLNLIKLVWEDIKIEQHNTACLYICRKCRYFAKKHLLNTQKKVANLLLPHEDRRGILATRWLNG